MLVDLAAFGYFITLGVFIDACGIETTSKFAETGLKIIQLIYWVLVLWLVLSKPELLTSILSKVKI